MKNNNLPEYLPEYKIEKSDEKSFSLKWEELMGWHLIPKLNEKISWGIYDLPSRKCDYLYDMKVIGRATVHGIEGVEILAFMTQVKDNENAVSIRSRTKNAQRICKHFVAYVATHH